MSNDPDATGQPASPLDIARQMAQEALQATQQQVDAAVESTNDALRAAIDATTRAGLGQEATQAVSQAEQALHAHEAAVAQAVQQAAQAQEQAVAAAQQQAEQAIGAAVDAGTPGPLSGQG